MTSIPFPALAQLTMDTSDSALGAGTLVVVLVAFLAIGASTLARHGRALHRRRDPRRQLEEWIRYVRQDGDRHDPS